MNFRYLFGASLTIPFLPIMYFQGKQIRARVPDLPEAKGKEGLVDIGASDQLSIITIGESTMAGVGVATHEEGFTGTLATEIAQQFNTNVKWKVYAKSGFTVKNVKEIILPKIKENKANLIVVGMGGNDAFKLNNPAKWKQQMKDLIEDLQSRFPNTPIVFTNMPPIKEFPAFTPLIKMTIGNLVEILGAELKDLVNKYDNVFYSSRIITIKDWIKRLNLEADTEDFFSDGVHPSKFTYQVWAKDIVSFIAANDQIKINPNASVVN